MVGGGKSLLKKRIAERHQVQDDSEEEPGDEDENKGEDRAGAATWFGIRWGRKGRRMINHGLPSEMSDKNRQLKIGPITVYVFLTARGHFILSVTQF